MRFFTLSASVFPVLEPSVDSKSYTDQSSSPLDSNQHMNTQLDEAQVREDSGAKNLNEDHVIFAFVPSRKIQEAI